MDHTDLPMNHTDLALTFVDSCCYASEGLWVPAKELWGAYREWSEGSNLRCLRRKDLLSRLDVYFQMLFSRPTRVLGLTLRDTEDWEWYDPHELRKVYLIHEGRYTKIGISIDPPTRMSMLQTGSANPLTLLHSWPGTYQQEAEIQKRYAHKHHRGEWYALDLEDIETITRLSQYLVYPSH